MPNNVTNKLIFAPGQNISHVIAACCPDGKQFDFKTLIPCPLSVYQGDISAEDDTDFRGGWNEWNRSHWGTKWNAYGGSIGVDLDRWYIRFDTAWAIPRPVIVALANKFLLPFEHRYYGEGPFWGIETWEPKEGFAIRTSARKNEDEDARGLCLELKGYDPMEDND